MSSPKTCPHCAATLPADSHAPESAAEPRRRRAWHVLLGLAAAAVLGFFLLCMAALVFFVFVPLRS